MLSNTSFFLVYYASYDIHWFPCAWKSTQDFSLQTNVPCSFYLHQSNSLTEVRKKNLQTPVEDKLFYAKFWGTAKSGGDSSVCQNFQFAFALFIYTVQGAPIHIGLNKFMLILPTFDSSTYVCDPGFPRGIIRFNQPGLVQPSKFGKVQINIDDSSYRANVW